MSLRCPHCNVELRVSEAPHADGGVDCPHCRAQQGARESVPPNLKDEPLPNEINGGSGAPPGVRVEELDGGMRFSLRWRRWEGVLPPLIAVPLFFGSLHLLRSGWQAGQPDFVNLLFAAGLGALGLGLLYWSLCVLVNRTVLEVAGGRLATRSGPLPWSRGRAWDREQVERFYSRSYIISGRRQKTFLHDLIAVLRDGRRVELLSGWDDESALRYLADRLQRACGAPAVSGPSATRPRAPVARPKSIREEHDGGTARWTYRWFSPGVLVQLLFVLIANGLVVGAGEAAFRRTSPLLCVLSPFALAGGFALYCVVCSLVNRTVVTVAGNGLTVRHGPLPLRRGLQLVRREMFQFFCYEDGRSRRYELRALLKDGSVRPVLSHLATPEEAIFLEQQIEKQLRIQDCEVPHESPI